MDGILVIDKPAGLTSRDVVNRVQRWFPRKTKIGHAGTLDPLATGVLVLAIGTATRLTEYIQALPKGYASRFRLGATSTTDDADGEVTDQAVAVPPTRTQIEVALESFVGTIQQIPPAFSALKVGGTRAHSLARKGKEVELAARPVRIDAIRVLAYEWPYVDVEVDCGKGTYIRSIARDLGRVLECGAIVETLRRTRIGPFRVEDAATLDLDPGTVAERIRPIWSAVEHLPRVLLQKQDLARFLNGQTVTAPTGGPWAYGTEVRVHAAPDHFLGVAEVVAGNLVRPRCVIASTGVRRSAEWNPGDGRGEKGSVGQ